MHTVTVLQGMNNDLLLQTSQSGLCRPTDKLIENTININYYAVLSVNKLELLVTFNICRNCNQIKHVQLNCTQYATAN